MDFAVESRDDREKHSDYLQLDVIVSLRCAVADRLYDGVNKFPPRPSFLGLLIVVFTVPIQEFIGY